MTTPRLSFAPFAPAHVDELLALFRDRHVRKYLFDDALVDRAWVEAEVRASEARFAAGAIGLYALSLHGAPAIVGFAGMRVFAEPELLYGLLPAYVGRGLASEAARAVLAQAFAAGEGEVRASVDAPNRASIALLERLRMRRVAERYGRLYFTASAPG